MKVSDIAASALGLGAKVPHASVFRPGRAGRRHDRRGPHPRAGLRLQSSEIVGSVAKGIGTPGVVPDIAGFAWRMPPMLRRPTPRDVLLASAIGPCCPDAGDNLVGCDVFELAAVAIR